MGCRQSVESDFTVAVQIQTKGTMNNGRHTAQSNDDERIQQQQFYQNNYGKILDSCLESRQLLLPDAERIVESLANHLSEFMGTTDEEFLAWANDVLKPAQQRLSRFYVLQSEYKKLIFHAIWRGLGHAAEPSKFDDYAQTVQELANEVWLYIFLHMDDLTDNGPAKISTRLFGLATRHTLNWRKKHQGRWAAVNRRLSQGRRFGVETLSGAEIAELKTIEREEAGAA